MLNSEIQMFLAKEQSDAATNGGRVDFTKLVLTGIAQNVWPHVPKAQRDSGDTQDRKVFIANRNPDGEALINPGLFYDGDTLGADYSRHFPVGQRDTQLDWTNTPPTRMFSSGVLDVAIGSTATSIVVTLAHVDQTADFIDLDQLYITDKVDPDSGAGNISQPKIDGTPVIASNKVTIPLDRQIGFAFSAAVTKIGSVYVPSTSVIPTIGTATYTPIATGTGTFDEDEVELDNLGTIEQILTLDFTGTNTFTVTSDDTSVGTSGVLAPGNITTEYAPDNPDSSTPYVTIPPTAWDGLFEDGDQLTIPLSPGTIPMVQRRGIPISCPSLANNRLRPVCIGESET